MKKLLNPKFANENIIVIEDSSSQEKLGNSEDDNKEVIKGKKPIVSKEKLVFTDTKISDIFRMVGGEMKLQIFHGNDTDDPDKYWFLCEEIWTTQ